MTLNKRNIYFFLLCFFSLWTSSTFAQQKNLIDGVAWIVGDEPILYSDIERQRVYLQQSGMKMDGDPICMIPEQIAIQKLFLRQAKIDSLYANETQVIQAADNWVNQKINEVGSRERLESLLGKTIREIKMERRNSMRDEFTVQMVQRSIIDKIKVSPSEVNRFYEKVDKDSLPFMPMTVEVQILSLRPQISITEVDKIKARLREYTKEINEGKHDFAFYARLYSKDNATALNGGEMGFLGKAQFEPEFAHVAFSLPPGKVSRIVQTRKGYHIMQLIDKRDDLINVRQIMLRPEVSSEEIASTTAKLDSIVKLVQVDTLDFGRAVLMHSYDTDTKNNNGLMVNDNKTTTSNLYGTSQFQMKDLPQEVAKVVDKMQVGDISEPFTMTDKDGNLVVAVVKLKERNAGHRANVNLDYQVIKEYLEKQRQNEAIENWIKEKQKETYVRISPEWQHCKFQYPGWVKH